MRTKNRPRDTANSTRIYIPFAPDELNEIDQWGFAKHIRARAQAIRLLVFKALASERRANSGR
jgi:hypothetical protein